MRITIISVGRIKEKFLAEAVKEYTKPSIANYTRKLYLTKGLMITILQQK